MDAFQEHRTESRVALSLQAGWEMEGEEVGWLQVPLVPTLERGGWEVGAFGAWVLPGEMEALVLGGSQPDGSPASLSLV